MKREEAILFAQISQGTYVDKFDHLKDFQLTATFENKGTDTQGVFGIAYKKRFVVAFRGSEETGIEDWITDLKFIKKVYPYSESNNKKVKVHYGFIQAYKSVREVILKAARATAAKEIICTGHSLGAGLATLCALDLQYNLPEKEISCCTYGSPRVGNKHFAASYNRRVPQTYRFVNRADLIPKLPIIGYKHIGQLYHLEAGSFKGSIGDRVEDHFPHKYVSALNRTSTDSQMLV